MIVNPGADTMRNDMGNAAELLAWLGDQKGSVATFYAIQHKALELRSGGGGQAALMRLLADMSGRFAERYDGEPLEVTTASAALSRLRRHLEDAAALPAGDPDALAVLLDRIAMDDLVVPA
jgi:hypothetical protein